MRSIAIAVLAATLALSMPSLSAQAAGMSHTTAAPNPGTPASGGTPGNNPDASASAGNTKADMKLEHRNDKIQSICKGC